MRSRAVVLVPLAVALTACSGGGGTAGGPSATTPPATTAPSIAVSVKPAPTQDNPGRHPITVDPCARLGDDVITRAGYDPATRARADQIHSDYSFVGCTFDHKTTEGLTARSLTVWSTNLSLDDFRHKPGYSYTPVTVAGHEAILHEEPPAHACYLEMPGPDGTFDISTSTGPFTSEKPCDRIRDVAGIIASAAQ